ncbi:MAG: T9SS type A sorting domain-containing protein, partial [Chitinophagales bacterium]
TVKSLTVNKKGNRIELSITNCDKIENEMDDEVATSDVRFLRTPNGYSMELTSAEAGGAELQIYDVMGRLVKHYPITYFEGVNNFELPSPGIGIFLVSIRSQSWVHTEKLLF